VVPAPAFPSADRARQGDGTGSADRGFGGAEEIGAGIVAANLGGFDEGIEDRRDLGSALGLAAVVVLPANDDTADLTLDEVMPRAGLCRVGAG